MSRNRLPFVGQGPTGIENLINGQVTPGIKGANPVISLIWRVLLAAYVIASNDVKDPEGYAGYSKLARPAIEKYGGKAIVRGGEIDVKEGGWHPRRMVIIQFESMQQARAFYDSPEYTEARAIRARYATTDFLIVEGI